MGLQFGFGYGVRRLLYSVYRVDALFTDPLWVGRGSSVAAVIMGGWALPLLGRLKNSAQYLPCSP